MRFLAGVLLAIVLAGCGRSELKLLHNARVAKGGSAIGAKPGDPLALGRAVYNFRCYFCHGYSGNAKTLAATYMTPAPRDFTAASPTDLPLEKIAAAVRDGRPGTGMKGFSGILDARETEAVAAFVFDEFVRRKAENTRYHTSENGWPNHQRYRAAFPFALGEIPLTADPQTLPPSAQAGRSLYLESCVSCHDRGKPSDQDAVWDSRPLSYPRHNYDHRNPEVDAATSATPYHLHDVRPRIVGATPREQHGEKIFQDNCAFCHAADGTGRNWIGRFLEPHPRNLTDPEAMAPMSRERLRQTIREGLPQTSMPAWKSVLSDRDIDSVIAYISKAFHPIKD